MRAVKGSLGRPLERRFRALGPSPGLMARLGVPVGGRVRKPRAVEDQSAPIPKSDEQAWTEYVFRPVLAVKDGLAAPLHLLDNR